MKKIAIALILGLFCLTSRAGEPYFCTSAGSCLQYERYKTGSNKLVQTTTLEINRLVPAAGGRREIRYAVTMRKNGKREMFGGRTNLVAMLDANGDIHTDFSASMAAVIKNMFPNSDPKITGTDGLLPSNIKPGDSLPDAGCSVDLGLVTVELTVTERKVLRRERITTPAGDFDCIVVRERKKEDSPLRHLDNYMDNWFVPNLGYVRHDVYDDKMVLMYTEVLKQIDKPAH